METPKPIELNHPLVTLKPLDMTEAEAYFEIGQDPDIWNYLAHEPFQSVNDAQNWIASRLQQVRENNEVAFSVYDNRSGQLAGSSSFLDVRSQHAGLEIGHTWYGKAFQRTYVNSATKLVLLTHAFNELKMHRVQLKTDARNHKSQAAIERLGAVREGVLRKHIIYPNGFVRDTVMYSITTDEWPEVNARLSAFLEQ